MSVQGYDSVNKIKRLIAGGTLWADCPVGTINAYGGTTAPDGWMLCQGQAISRTDYADLFKVIGTNFGSGDGSTTFNLPDMREATFKGAGTTSKTVGTHNTINVGDFVDDRVQSHTHTGTNAFVVFYNGEQGNPLVPLTGGTGYIKTADNMVSTDNSGRKGTTTEVKAVGVNYIIKAKQMPMPADLEAAINEIDFLTWGNNT